MPQAFDFSSQIAPPNLGQLFTSGLQAGAGVRALIDKREAAALAAEKQKQYSVDLTAALQDPTPQSFATLSVKYPDQGQALKQSWGILNEAQKDSEFSAGAQVYNAIRSGSPDVAMTILDERIEAMKNSNQDTTELESIRTGLERDPESAAAHIGLTLSSVDPDRWAKMAKALGARGGATGTEKSFAPITLINPETKDKLIVFPTFDPTTGKPALKAADMPEGFEISTETSAEKRAADVLATGEKEEIKLSAQLRGRPAVEAAIVKAKADAKTRGETFDDAARASAAMPELERVVDSLRSLSSVATYTTAGRGFNVLSKELGFGASKGATARAKYIAIVNNQVLPLLKATFGGSFTVQEGESLKATMGDPDSTPEEKQAQLDAFIEQKRNELQTKQAVAASAPETQPSAVQSAPQRKVVVDF